MGSVAVNAGTTSAAPTASSATIMPQNHAVHSACATRAWIAPVSHRSSASR